MRGSIRFAQETTLFGRRFVIHSILGSGGMGVVYEAFDTERDAAVALKRLSVVDASSIYCLKQEFRALVDVDHPKAARRAKCIVSERWCT